ncbi:molecular chaperone TorD family protein [Vibrio sp. Vf1514]|uniref:molecular chaperone TorD family protein n=1 Tax=Vibrio sp. Vf1514 TaxID=3437381 RepID=UPI003F888D4A
MSYTQLEAVDLGTVLKLFGALFYYAPNQYQNANLDVILAEQDVPFAALKTVMDAFGYSEVDLLQAEHDRLFAGLGDMPAPPWGSVYLDKEAVLFGESTVMYRQFLRECGVALSSQQNEPEDQIGLMLMVAAMLLENDQHAQFKALLGEHLMPWFGYYMAEFKRTVESPAYALLAEQTQELLHSVCERDAIVPIQKRNYFNAIL